MPTTSIFFTSVQTTNNKRLACVLALLHLDSVQLVTGRVAGYMALAHLDRSTQDVLMLTASGESYPGISIN